MLNPHCLLCLVCIWLCHWGCNLVSWSICCLRWFLRLLRKPVPLGPLIPWMLGPLILWFLLLCLASLWFLEKLRRQRMSEMHLPGTGASVGNLILLPRLTRCNKRSKDMDHATRVHVQSSRRVRIQNQRWVIQTRNVTAKGSRQKKQIFYGQADHKCWTPTVSFS